MKHSIPNEIAIVVILLSAIVMGDSFELSRSTHDGGGAIRSVSADGAFVLSGTIGQADAGVMSGGNFKLTGGFWFELPPGDCNGNGVVGLLDHEALARCMRGPSSPVTDECTCFDVNRSGAIDLFDFAEQQRGFHGE